jgi:hypothetical protein
VRIIHGVLEHTRGMDEVISRGDFWNDAAVTLVFLDLRCDFARKQLIVAQNSDGGFVTGSFDRQDGHDCSGGCVNR